MTRLLSLWAAFLSSFVIICPLALASSEEIAKSPYWTFITPEAHPSSPLVKGSELIAQQRALVCAPSQLQECATLLPDEVRGQLPQPLTRLKQMLGRRGAMVIPLDHQTITGLILLSPADIVQQQTLHINQISYSLALQQAAQLTLWHELGHLAALQVLDSQLQAQVGQIGKLTIVPAYQHEWMADLYLIWRIAKQTQSFELMWQQYHRRNMAVMDNVAFMSHWTVPILYQAMNEYEAAELARFPTFMALWQDFQPKMMQSKHWHDQSALNEFSSLIQRTFGRNVSQILPRYMYWRRPKLSLYMTPTLVHLMGEPAANTFVQEMGLVIKH